MSPLLVKNYDDPTDVEHEKAAMCSQLAVDELQLLVDDTVTQVLKVLSILFDTLFIRLF